MDAFEKAVLGWHDFYISAASASAALLGLLFVGVSIALTAASGSDRSVLRARARQAFSNLSLILVISLFMLIPAQDPRTLGAELAVVAVMGLVGFAERFRALFTRAGLRQRLADARRALWSVIGLGVLAVVAVEFLTQPAADAKWLYWLLFVIFFFVSSAAGEAWGMLVHVGDERSASGGGRP